jgi:apolipoprotein N-acyltransferase
VGCYREASVPPGVRYYNSVILTEPNGRIRSAGDKRFLTPGLEFDPLRSLWEGHLVAAPARGNSPPLSPGAVGGTLRASGSSARLAVGVCHDVCFDQWSRDLFSNGMADSPDFIVYCARESPDATFRAQRLLLNCARYRAIEVGRPVVRCVKDGYSAVIDARGRVTRSSNGRPFIAESLPQDHRQTGFVAVGRSGIEAWVAGWSLVLVIFAVRKRAVAAKGAP